MTGTSDDGVSKAVEEAVKSMLDVRTQLKAHCKDKALRTHACAKCVMEAMGAGWGGRISQQDFEEKLCGALSSVFNARKLVPK